MAMNGDVLGLAIKAAVHAAAAIAPTDSDAIFKAMGNAIVDHITATAVVTSSVTVVSVSGVTTGAGVSGPGTGSATGGIT